MRGVASRLTLGSFLALLVCATAIARPAEQAGRSLHCAVGTVFRDDNRNGTRDPGEKGLPDVRVSNGRAIVTTDATGRYKLSTGDDTIIFVIKPRGWRTPVDGNNVPRFHYIHKPNGSPTLKYRGVDPTGPLPASIDFPLYPQDEPDSFKALFFGDTQTYDQNEINYLAHDLVEELAGSDAAFGVTLGDIVGDDLSLYEDLTAVLGRVGVPWYYVKGNHDANYDAAPNHKLTDETFERVFGPPYYSFDYGPVHFVALNNPYWTRPKGYGAQLDFNQMAFLRNDLALVPRHQLVVLMMHIPIVQMADRQAIFRLIESRPHTFSISGHWHTQGHFFLTSSDGWNGLKPHHHLVNVTACGSWWAGTPDEVGIPHTVMYDGAPNGYSVVTFDGSSYSIRFKAARRPADYQMNIFAPETITAAEAEKTEVVVNVFAGSERSKVVMRLGDVGPWLPMEKVKREDPYFLLLKRAEEGPNPPAGHKLPDSQKEVMHLWRAYLPKDAPAGVSLIHVRETDMFGQVHSGRRVIRIR